MKTQNPGKPPFPLEMALSSDPGTQGWDATTREVRNGGGGFLIPTRTCKKWLLPLATLVPWWASPTPLEN